MWAKRASSLQGLESLGALSNLHNFFIFWKFNGEPIEMPVCSNAETKSAYELIRDQNLADLETFRQTHNILPASKI